MVMAVTKQEEPAIKVDDSRKYRINAGNCDKCGYFKSWDFKINDGDCPFYALLKGKADAKAAAESTTIEKPKTKPEPAKVKPIKQSKQGQPAQEVKLTFSVAGESIIATIGTCSADLSKLDAIRVCRDLLSLFCD